MFVVIQWENRTAYDTFDEESFQGETNIPQHFETFETEEKAEEYYRLQKANSRWLFGPAIYWGYPQEMSAEDIKALEDKINRLGEELDSELRY